MTLENVMSKNTFVVLGDTKSPEKYAYKIKNSLLKAGYNVYCVPKEIARLDDINDEIEVLDLVINPIQGIKFLKETNKKIGAVVIQPGAESDEIKRYLEEKNTPYIEACVLVGLRLYPKK
ncbi:MAG: CoA-binding protein [Christensenellaceae bacterium]|nr:CoA-binding protein [Christensenellaceae bacterium]